MMIRWFAKNDIAANLITIGIIWVGFFIVMPRMPVEINPTYPYRTVHLSFSVRGITAEEIEKIIVKPVESLLTEISGIDSIYVSIRYGRASFFIYADDDVDLQDIKTDIESAVQELPSLPPDADKPVVRIPDPSKYKDVISLMVMGDLSRQELTAAARKVRDDLMATPGISYAQVQGFNTRRMNIEPNLETLRTHNLSISQISKAISDSSLNLTTGRISTDSRGINVMANNQATTKEDFENIKIRTINNAELLIKDIAKVSDSKDAEDKIIMCNGRPCIRVEVMRLHDESTLEVADKVKEYADDAKQHFPESIEIAVWDDESIGLRSRISILTENLMQGAILVFISLALFLRPSIALFVVLGIPTSFAGGLIIMHLMGVSINMWTLFGFIVVLGIIVDDAIVTADSIHESLKSNSDRLEAVVKGTTDVSTPVTFGVLTTMVAFVPLMFLPGDFGTISKQIPLVIIPVLAISLLESKFIIPGHLKHNFAAFEKFSPFPIIHRYVNWGLAFFLNKIYSPTLNWCIAFRWPVIAACGAILAMTYGYIDSPNFSIEKFPDVERPIIRAHIQMTTDTTVEQTHQKVMEIAAHRETLAKEFMDGNTGKSLIGNIFTSSGGASYDRRSSPNHGYLYLEVTPPSLRDKNVKDSDMVSNTQIAERWRELIGEIEGANRITVEGIIEKSRSTNEDAQIELEIRSENDEQRMAIAQEIRDWIKAQEWASFASYERAEPMRELHFKVNENGAAAGLTDRDLAFQVRGQILGQEAQTFPDGEDEVTVFVALPDEEKENQQLLNTLRIRTKDAETSFRSVATLTETFSPSTITRSDRSRIESVSASTKASEKGRLNLHLESIRKEMNASILNYPQVTWRFVGQVAKNAETEKVMKIGFITLIFVLFSLIAIPLKSVVQPLFVLTAIPIGVVGAILGHHHFGVTLSYLSIFGILALAGVVVNDSLVMVDFINRKNLEGHPLKKSITEAGLLRFRPIMLTSLTTFAGLLPIMLEKSVESLFLRPMAISLGIGIVYATVVTLYLVPCAYMAYDDLKKFLRWFFFQ
jgi:multidrug efflux pump subunit AcrB